MYLDVPNSSLAIPEGAIVRLSRFESEEWRVLHGWYTWGGNRPFCGWYMVSLTDPKRVKPVQLPDMYDVIVIRYEAVPICTNI